MRLFGYSLGTFCCTMPTLREPCAGMADQLAIAEPRSSPPSPTPTASAPRFHRSECGEVLDTSVRATAKHVAAMTPLTRSPPIQRARPDAAGQPATSTAASLLENPRASAKPSRAAASAPAPSQPLH